MGHKRTVTHLKLSNDESSLFSASSDETIKIWNTRSGKNLKTLKGHNGSVYVLEQTKDSNYLFSGGYDNTVIQWRLDKGVVHRKLEGFHSYLTSMVFSGDHKVLYSISGEDSNFIRYLGEGELYKNKEIN